MKKTKFFFLPLFIYLFNFGFCENFPFNVGETINYTAKFNFIPAGSAGLKIVSLDTLNGLQNNILNKDINPMKFSSKNKCSFKDIYHPSLKDDSPIKNNIHLI